MLTIQQNVPLIVVMQMCASITEKSIFQCIAVNVADNVTNMVYRTMF